MTTIAEEVAKTLVQRLIDGAIGEVNYLCCFRTHVANFEKKRKILVAKKNKVLKDIEDAKKRNETQVEDDVLLWLDNTNEIIDEGIKTNMKCFHGWRPNCIWQYKQGKKLAEKIPDITDLIERCSNFDKVARLAQSPGITYYSPQNFIDFDSRKSKFKNLVDILQDGSYSLIGLHGLGGTGKTTLATKVGQQVEESKAFQKVVFVVVSNPPDTTKIRRKIASQLELQLEGGKEEEHSVFLWSRIANYEGKVLIILDDIWQSLNLKDIGIPYGQNHKNCCVLITTRDSKVCEQMECQQKVALQTLTDDDALNLFIKQFGERSEKSSCEFMDLAGGISKECGGLPLAVVAVATILKGWPLRDWKCALKALQKSEPLHNVHKDLVQVYRSLKLSYDHLEKKAQCLLLLCSIFPEDFEIPIDLLSKLGIGLGLFGGVNKYFGVRRREAIAVKNDLINSSLLLEANKVCVKMHDLVREVALWIADENVQVIINSSAIIKSNLQVLFWRNYGFPNCFEATKLEVLIIYIEGVANVRYATIFEGMTNLKVLFLEGPSLFTIKLTSLRSLLSLKNIRTLIFSKWILGNISILKNLEFLESFELEDCIITKLLEGFIELKRLKLLGLRECYIDGNNPFEVIERCSQLEELYFVNNSHAEPWKLAENTDEVAQDICPPMLQRYSIACPKYGCFIDDDRDGLLNCFNVEHARELMSKSMFNDLVGRAEVLEFCETGEAHWKSLVDGRMMSDLIKLSLCNSAYIRCLIDIDTPDGSFRQLQILKLQNCKKLHHLCFDGNLKLPHLKSLHLDYCPMLEPSIFQLQPPVTLCVERLEELVIEDCKELRSLITYESLKEEKLVNVDQQKSYCSSFQKLKSLKISNCDKLELVLPLFSAGEFPLLELLMITCCNEMKCIFGEYREVDHTLNQHIILPSLTEIELGVLPSFIGMVGDCKICTQRSSCAIIVKDDSKEKKAIPFSGGFGSCFLPTTKDIDIKVSSSSSQSLKSTQESYYASSKKIETFHTAECLIRQPLSLQNIREMRLCGCSKLKSLFSVSIATTIMLEKLEIKDCKELKHITTNDEEDDDHLNHTSIFPELKRLYVFNCHNLEFIFPSTLSGGLQKLQIMSVDCAYLLKYVFGACNKDQNINVVPINLPALEVLALERVPQLISLCTNSYYVVWPPLQHITLDYCWGVIESTLPDFMASHQGRKLELNIGKGLITGSSLFPDFMICLSRQPNMETLEDYMKITMSMQNLVSLEVGQSETIEEIFNAKGIQSEGPVTLSLQEMELKDLGELRHIYKDPNNILRLLHLKDLKIKGCGKLRALFTASMGKSLQRLSSLEVSGCEELVHIIEEDENDETSGYGGGSHQRCFPMLQSIYICSCDRLKSLFSISTTSTMLPNLNTLYIGESARLEEVFRRQQYDTQEISIQNMFPNLSTLRLFDLTELRTICRGINFHCVPDFEVFDCPKYTENESPTGKLHATDCDSDQAMSDLGEAKLEQEIETQEMATSASPNFTETEGLETGNEVVGTLLTLGLSSMATTSSNVKSNNESIPEDTTTMKGKISTPPIYSQAEGLKTYPPAQGSETGKEACGTLLTSWFSLAITSSNVESTIESVPEDTTTINGKISTPKVTPSIEGTFKQGPQQNYEAKKVTIAKTNKETSNASDLEGHRAQKVTEANLSTQSQSYLPNTTNHNTILPDLIPCLKYQNESPTGELHATDCDFDQAMSDLGEAKLEQEIEKQLLATSASPNITETELINEQPRTEQDLVDQLNSREATSEIKVPHPANIAIMEDAIEQRFQEQDGSKEIIIHTNSNKDLHHGTETGKEAFGTLLTSGLSMATTSSNVKSNIKSIPEETRTMKGKISTPPIFSQAEGLHTYPPAQVTPSIEGTLEQGPQQSNAAEEVKMANKSIDLDPKKKSIPSPKEASKDISKKVSALGTSSKSILFHSEFTNKETRNASDLEGHKEEKATEANPSKQSQSYSPNTAKHNTILADVILPLQHQPQIGVASSSSPTLEIGEIIRLVELKESEEALLTNALEQYPKLKLPRERRTNRIIALSYRVIVDILIMLTNKTPCTITTSDRSILEDNLEEAMILGFDNEWIESVRAKISGSDMLDILVAEKEIKDMEVKLEACEFALDDVRKRKVELLEAIDFQLLGLLEDRKKLVTKMQEIRGFMSSKDKPFGI